MLETTFIKDLLFKYSNLSVPLMSNLKVGMNGPAGIVSQYNDSSRQIAKINAVAVAVCELLNNKLPIVKLEQGTYYVEYEHSDHSCDGMVINFPESQKKIHLSNCSKESVGKYEALVGIVACVEHVAKESEFAHYSFDKIVPYIQNLKGSLREDSFYLFSDAFYYLFKDYMVSIDENNKITQNVINSLQNNFMPELLTPDVLPKLFSFDFDYKEEEKEPEEITMFNEPLDVFYQRCLNGEFKIKYPWSEKQKEYIVPETFLQNYVPTEAFRNMLLSVWSQIKRVQQKIANGYTYQEIIGKNPINIKVMGKPATGKTVAIEAVLAALGYPKGMINCKDRMEEDEIEGQNKFINGKVWNVPTKAGEFHSVGGAIILEEFNLADPGILQGTLGQALAYPFILKVDGYLECKRHPLTIYFGTMNIGTNGSKLVNEALSSRFAEGFVMEDLSDKELTEIFKASGYSSTNCGKVIQTYKNIITYLQEFHEEFTLCITLRHCICALDKMRMGFSPDVAYECSFISELYAHDPEIASNVREYLKVLG